MSKKPLNLPPAVGVAAGVAVGAVAAGAAALAVGSSCLRLARTQAGIARVKSIRGERGEKIRVLQQGGVYQSATYLGERRFEPVFTYYRAFDAMFEAEPALRAASGHGVERVLMLGGGGYAYPKHALTQHAGLAMDVVEIDPAVTRLARRWFFLNELERLAGDRLRAITADARSYLTHAVAEGLRYDVIVNDCFSGFEPARRLATVEALCQAKVCLRPGGLYLANIVTTDGGENIDFLRDATATAATVFAHVHIVPCEDTEFGGEDNYLFVATDGEYEFEGELAMPHGFFGSVLTD